MKKFLSFLLNIFMIIWQLPQLFLGFLVWLFGTKNKKRNDTEYSCRYFYTTEGRWGVSLSHFIIINKAYHDKYTLLHEAGHKKQSKIFGPLYLLIIGLPSITFNIIDRYFHNSWSNKKRTYWYYHLPWEYGANKLSGIDVDENGRWSIVDEEKNYNWREIGSWV